MAHAFFLGVDVHDAATQEVTFVLLEKEKNPGDDAARYRLDHLRHVQELDSMEALADHLQGLVSEQPYIGRTSLIINRGSEAGQALVDALRDRGLDPVRATLTAGGGVPAAERDEEGVRLGTAGAVQALVELYRDGRFAVEEHSREGASRLAREIQHAFEVLDEAEGDQASGESMGDLQALREAEPPLTSAALAAWLGRERTFDPSKHLKDTPQTGRTRGTAGP
ncbi:MAG: hypothetical protein ACLFTE_08215 [Salinivenus sp.]